ncbi:unnamed protein product [Mytilus edulis]|uniref:Integrase catalytic domain-containing protein n=1 Tax=Mytilus edulis TaxID=6550 RepID=A0A8S3PT34_MYTED|nr:unnamed protein product [Mytilus edulis]
MFLIVIDAHSKWPEVIPMKSTTSTQTIRVLRTIFARAGLPEQIVSDNGPQFVSAEFQTFTKMNGITHIKSAPYHPATNGLAERFVQTFKQSLKAMRGENADLNKKLANFLLAYRNTPHTTTNETPAKLFMGRNLRNRLDLIKPDINRQVQDKQMKIAIKPTKETLRQFTEGETVAVRDYRGPNKWTSGLITKREGPLNYQVEVSPNSIWKRHADQIRNSDFNDKQGEEIKNDKTVEIEIIPDEPTEQPAQDLQPKHQDSEQPLSEPIQRRYPLRTRKPVTKLNLYWCNGCQHSLAYPPPIYNATAVGSLLRVQDQNNSTLRWLHMVEENLMDFLHIKPVQVEYKCPEGGNEFNRLSNTVGSNIQKITQNVSQIQRLVGVIGTSQDSQDFLYLI